MTQEEFDFLVMVVELSRTEEVKRRVQALHDGAYDGDLKLALNRARRLRRWLGRNDPNEDVRADELERAAKGFNHFAGSDVMMDERFRRAKSAEERLTICYAIVDVARQEADVYVTVVKERFDTKYGTTPSPTPVTPVPPVTPVTPVTPSPAPAPEPPAPIPPKARKRTQQESRTNSAFVSVEKYFVTSPEDVVNITRDYRGTIAMNGLSQYEAGEILGALKDHFYLDRENAADIMVAVGEHAPLHWFGAKNSIEAIVLDTIRAKQTSREFEALRRTFSNALHRYDVR